MTTALWVRSAILLALIGTTGAQSGAPAATASSIENSGFPPSFAVDGNLQTRWSSTFADPQWLRIDFGAERDISRVVLHWETAYASAYALQTSTDGQAWTTIFATSSGDGGIDDVATPGARGRYLRMFGTARATQWGYSLYEVEVFGAASGGGGPFAGAVTVLPGTVQAEQFDEGGAGVAYADSSAGNEGGQFRGSDVDIEATTDAGGGFNVGWIAPGEWLRYSVYVQSAGDYRLEFRVASQGRGGTFHLEVNGSNTTGPLTIPNTGGWQAWTTVTVPRVTLATGPQTWRLVFDTLGPDGIVGNINYIAVAPVSTAAGPTPMSGTPVSLPGVVQAENFDHGGAGVAYFDASAGNTGGAYRATDVDLEPTSDTGGGFNVGWISPGEWLKYTVSVAAAGAYDIGVRVAARGTGGTFHIEIDGVDRTGPLSIPDTGAWQAWTTVTARGVPVGAGRQIWTIVFDGSGPGGVVGNVNHITVSPASQVPGVTIARAPYLQQVTPTSAIVMWTTHEANTGSVRYASAAGGSGTAGATRTLFAASVTGLPADYHQHEARISGLVPGSTYSYIVQGNGADLSGTASTFTTAPFTGTSAIRFVAFGDSGVGSSAQSAVAARLAADQFDLALHTGDVAYGGTNGFGGGTHATYESWVFGMYAAWMRSRPFYPSIGNHDDETNAALPYRRVFTLPEGGATSTFPDHAERYYSFDYGPVHFVALDTETAFANSSRRAAMLAWLEADLAATSQPWRVAYFHRPPYSAGPHHGSDVAVRAAFSPIFERYGVQLVLSGHEHMYERTLPWREHIGGGGFVTYLITGGGGATLHPTGWAPWTAATASRHHYVRVAVDSCVLRGEAIGADGSVFDTFRIDRCPQ